MRANIQVAPISLSFKTRILLWKWSYLNLDANLHIVGPAVGHFGAPQRLVDVFIFEKLHMPRTHHCVCIAQVRKWQRSSVHITPHVEYYKLYKGFNLLSYTNFVGSHYLVTNQPMVVLVVSKLFV